MAKLQDLEEFPYHLMLLLRSKYTACSHTILFTWLTIDLTKRRKAFPKTKKNSKRDSGTPNVANNPCSTWILDRPNCEIAPPGTQIDVRYEQLRFEKGPQWAWSIRQGLGQNLHMRTTNSLTPTAVHFWLEGRAPSWLGQTHLPLFKVLCKRVKPSLGRVKTL